MYNALKIYYKNNFKRERNKDIGHLQPAQPISKWLRLNLTNLKLEADFQHEQ